MKRNLPLVAASLVLSAAPLYSQSAIWGHRFSDGSIPAVSFDAGTLIPWRNQSFTTLGYALKATSQLGDSADNSDFEVQSLARFDANGVELWTTRLDTTPLIGSRLIGPDLLALRSSTERFFATYSESQNGVGEVAFRLGVFKGSDSSPVFAKRITRLPTTPHSVDLFDESHIGVTVDRGNQIDFLVLDESGTPVFDKTYSAPPFMATDGLGSQSVVQAFIPDQSEYLTSVMRSAIEVVPPADVKTTTQITPFYLGLDGAVKRSGGFSYESGTQMPPFPRLMSDGGSLYLQLSSDGGLVGGGDPVTHLVRVKPDGSVGWSKTVRFASLAGGFPTPDALYLGGSFPADGGGIGESDAAIIRLNPDTGELVSQITFDDIRFTDTANIMVTSSNVFALINSIDPPVGGAAPESTSTLIKMDLNLNLISAVRYEKDHLFSSLIADDDVRTADTFVLSVATLDGAVEAYTVNSDLQTLRDCEGFESVTPALRGSLTVVDLAVTAEPTTVTAVDNDTVLTDTTMPLAPFELTVEDLCGAVVLTPNVQLKLNEAGDGLNLCFPSKEQVEYTVSFSETLQGFTPIGTITGDGGELTFPVSLGQGKGFVIVSPDPLAE